MACWNEYSINTKEHTTVAHRLDSACQKVVETNRHYVKTVAEVLLLCAKQDLHLRGHREYSESKNQGNFREILTLVPNHDAVVREKLQDGPHNAMYSSPEIQNTLLEIMVLQFETRFVMQFERRQYFRYLLMKLKMLARLNS